MTSTTSTLATRRLDLDTLRQLARRRGVCLTILLPPSHPGAAEGDKLTTFRSLCRSLVSSERIALRDRMESALIERGLKGGGPGLALFGGPDFLEIYRAPVKAAQIFEGSYCLLLPFLLDSSNPQDFFVLGLSKKLLRLLHYEQGECTALELPAGMPTSLEEVHGVEARDHNMENRAPAGTAQGNLHAVRFGTSAEREDSAKHLEHFFARLDESLAPLLGKRSLLLMGVEEEIATFRRVAKHCSIFKSQISQGMRDLPLREITQLAGECALVHGRGKGLESYLHIQERISGRPPVEEITELLECARAGRIQSLCVPELAHGQHDSNYREAQLNAAVAETLSHGGEVSTVLPAEVAPASALAALLRY